MIFRLKAEMRTSESSFSPQLKSKKPEKTNFSFMPTLRHIVAWAVVWHGDALGHGDALNFLT